MLNPNEVGQRLRELREQRLLSLRRLAADAGVAVSFLSKIEAGHGSPTLSTLQKLLDALGVSVPEFFASPEAPVDGVLIVPRQRMQVLDDGDKLWRYLLPNQPDIKVVLTSEEFRPHTRHVEEERHPFDIAGYVEQGTLTLTVPGQPDRQVQAGDAFYIRAGTPHAAANQGDEVLQLIAVQLPHTTERPLRRGGRAK